jgi:hypothetical protein
MTKRSMSSAAAAAFERWGCWKARSLPAGRAFLFRNGYLLEPAEEDEVLTRVAVAEGSETDPVLGDSSHYGLIMTFRAWRSFMAR